MEKFIKTTTILLLSLFAASCDFTRTQKSVPENVCTLTPEKIPEVRGFRIGMEYGEILKRFPHLCTLETAVMPSQDITFYKSNEKEPQNLADCNKFTTSQSTIFNTAQHSELDGLNRMRLKFEKLKLTSIEIEYGYSGVEFAKGFQRKTREALGLLEWTNWITEKENRYYGAESLYDVNAETNLLLCNKVIIRTELVSNTIKSSNQNAVAPSGEAISDYYIPSLSIYETDKIAISSIEQQNLETRKEIERRDAEKQKTIEDRKRGETFKP